MEKLELPVTAPNCLDELTTHVLQEAARPVPLAQLRQLCRVRNATLHERLRALTAAGLLLRDAAGYRLATPPS